jgi:ABC-type transport system involved in cytochrome c biogenesis permease subunit
MKLAETLLLWSGLLAYLAAAVASWRALLCGRTGTATAARALIAGAALVAAALAARWLRLGHGPFFNLYEILASSLVSLGSIYAIARARSRLAAGVAPVVYLVLALLAVWLATAPAADSHFAPTYATPLLWLHVGFGKVFLGLALIAVGLAGVVLARLTVRGRRWFARLAGDAALDATAWRALQAALVFETLMLIAGAVWAQDAWGRYWAWDPLETWAFMTWLALVGALHWRASARLAPRTGAALVVAVFVLAFLTFFGVPFVSEAPHQGAI